MSCVYLVEVIFHASICGVVSQRTPASSFGFLGTRRVLGLPQNQFIADNAGLCQSNLFASHL